MKLKNSININTVSVGVTPLLPISQALLGQRSDFAPFDPRSFTHAWTVQNMSNTSPTRNAIPDRGKDPKNLILSGQLFAQGSGYYKGYLEFDGVDDKAQTEPFEMGKDWTLVGNWVMGEVTENRLAGISKAIQLFAYNYQTNTRVYINTGGLGLDVPSKTIKAICSDGRIYYGDDWTEVINDRPQTSFSSMSALAIGCTGSTYTPMKFRTLGIYDGQVLSLAECQKAYDYLEDQFDPMSFDEAWTVRGKTNTSADKDILQSLRPGGSPLTLFGFDYAEGSGYENGYLQFDGVDDKAQTSPFEIGADWTLVGNWELAETDTVINAGFTKASQLFMYNHPDGSRVYVNTGSLSHLVPTKSIKAICSDGRIYYGDDWTEFINDRPQMSFSSSSAFVVGNVASTYTAMKFKNAAWYNNRVLTRAKAMKAYNTLQTL